MVSGFVNSCNLTEAVLEICEWYIIVATCDAWMYVMCFCVYEIHVCMFYTAWRLFRLYIYTCIYIYQTIYIYRHNMCTVYNFMYIYILYTESHSIFHSHSHMKMLHLYTLIDLCICNVYMYMDVYIYIYIYLYIMYVYI